jgi:hypothetical protein
MAGSSAGTGRSVTSKITSILPGLYRRWRAHAHRDRPPHRPARLHRTSPDGRARVVADAGTQRRGALPRRAPVAGWTVPVPPARPASPNGRRACSRSSWEPPTCVPARVLDRLKVAHMEKQPGRRPVSGFTPVATLPAHPTALGRALPAFCPFAVEMTIRRGLRALHPAHRDLARPLPPRAGRHPAHPGRGDPRGVQGAGLRGRGACLRSGW